MQTSETGRIFDVRRFSTHDGGGIRTTVFLKGCPLRCMWCHNPEGINSGRRPVWFPGKCIGCGSCADAAKHGGALVSEGKVLVNPDAPEDWDGLMDSCPTGALHWDSRDISADALMEEILRDEAFFRHGGGVTLSGGDPLMQPGFSREILQRCRERGIHTAVETELYASWEAAWAVLEYADLVYADLKIMDGEVHRKYTGAGNDRILQNLRRLLEGEKAQQCVVRTPLIPGITATEENIAAIGSFLCKRQSDVKWELLNYNPLAAAKYPLVEKKFLFEENPPRYSREEMEAFREIARCSGVKNIVCDE